MFENDGIIYYVNLFYFCVGFPFAVVAIGGSFYYFFSWITARNAQLLKAAAYCFVDGVLSFAFSSIGVWLVIREFTNNWYIFFVAIAISVPHMIIARKIRAKVF